MMSCCLVSLKNHLIHRLNLSEHSQAYEFLLLIWSLLDKRVPGYIEGYVRRFWQARYIAFAYQNNALDLH